MDNILDENIINKISNVLTINELDYFVKYIWMHDTNNIELLVNSFIYKMDQKLKTEE